MNFIFELIVSLLLIAAAFFTLVGAIGLVRLQDFYMRLHSPTKASTLGVGGVLLASIAYSFSDLKFPHELLITLFVFVTAPVSAHLLCQAAIRLKLRSQARLPNKIDY